MRIFQSSNGKTNFVDTNDVYVGFDSWQSCCESFGYFFTYIEFGEVLHSTYGYDHPKGDPENRDPENLAHLVFDPTFFQTQGDSDGGGYAIFRLVDPTNDWGGIFLVLYNHHNGYYGHGFEVKHGGEVVRSGSL